MAVRTKFKLISYNTHLHWNDPTKELRTLKFAVVNDNTPENKEFFEATPMGEVSLGVLNKAAWEHFELGKEYYVDFTPAE